jgi:hypothetical protein
MPAAENNAFSMRLSNFINCEQVASSKGCKVFCAMELERTSLATAAKAIFAAAERILMS